MFFRSVVLEIIAIFGAAPVKKPGHERYYQDNAKTKSIDLQQVTAKVNEGYLPSISHIALEKRESQATSNYWACHRKQDKLDNS
jgi:hypothetical protein